MVTFIHVKSKNSELLINVNQIAHVEFNREEQRVIIRLASKDLDYHTMKIEGPDAVSVITQLDRMQ